MSSKSIVIVRKYLGYGGIEHQIESIAAGLKESGYTVLFLSDQKSPLTQSIEQMGIETCVIPFTDIFHTALQIRKICKERKAEIVQSHMLWESFVCRLVKLLMPKIKHVFRVHTYIDCSHIARGKKNLYHVACRLTDFLVDRYISINAFNVKEMRARTHLPERKIAVVHNAVRLQLTRKPMFAPKNGKMAMVANFVDFKGHDVLLKGIKILVERGHDVTAYLIGSAPGVGTPHEDNRRLHIVQETIQEYHLEKNVVLCGFSADIEAAVHDCGLMVLPSDAEGTPNVLLEGMVFHKIVVASSVGGVPEFVKEGETGFLHAAQDPIGFAEAVLRVYASSDEKLEQIARNAEETVREQYSKKQMLSGLLEQYCKL